jgi:hypothetical protein
MEPPAKKAISQNPIAHFGRTRCLSCTIEEQNQMSERLQKNINKQSATGSLMGPATRELPER